LVSGIGAGLVIFYSLIERSGGLNLADAALLGALASTAIGMPLEPSFRKNSVAGKLFSGP